MVVGTMNTTNGTELTLDEALMAEWNRDVALTLVPIDVVLLLYIVVGIIGNILVIYIYSVKLRVKFEDKFFIMVLAFMDIIVCFIGPVFSLSRNIIAVNYDQDIVCRVTFFLTRSMATASGILLFGIAVQRYLKVCRPLGRQMTPFMTKVLLLVTIGTAVSIDIPILFFYGRIQVSNQERGILGYRCGRRDGDYREEQITGINFYFMFMFMCALSVMVSVTTLYIIIYREIHRQLKEQKYLINPSYKSNGRGSVVSDSAIQNATCSSKSEFCDITPKTSPDLKAGRESVKLNGHQHENNGQVAPSQETVQISFPVEREDDGDKEVKRPSNKMSFSEQVRGWKAGLRKGSDPAARENRKKILRQQSSALSLRLQKNKQMAHRFSILFMVITFVCTITYLPGIIINFLVNMDASEFWSDNYPTSRRCLYLFLFQMYLANHVANPFIYTFFDKKFREELKKMVTCNSRLK